VGIRLIVEFRELERQHRELFALMYQYSSSIGKGARHASALPVLEKFLACAKNHFTSEENLLASLPQFGAQRLRQHQIQHCRIVEQFDTLTATLAQDAADFPHDEAWTHVMNALLVHHVRDDAESSQDLLKYL